MDEAALKKGIPAVLDLFLKRLGRIASENLTPERLERFNQFFDLSGHIGWGGFLSRFNNSF